MISCSAYVLYDKIPFVRRVSESSDKKTSINVPICVIVIQPNTPLDNIYLFFNAKMTIDDITSIVRLFLGIPINDGFELVPNISTPPPAPEESLLYMNVHTDVYPSPNGAVHLIDREVDNPMSLSATMTVTEIPNKLLLKSVGNTFIKICRCSGLSLKYCIEFGTFDPNTPLDKVKTTRHEIKTHNTGYTSLNGKAIKAILDNKELIQKVRESNSVLPTLYQSYFTLFESEKTVDINDKAVVGHFGLDIEGPTSSGKKETWDKKAKSYEDFKNEHMERIRERENDKRHHRTYGLDKDQFDTLKSTRPLEITTPTQIGIDSNTNKVSNIINTIDQSVENIIFTNLSDNWWSKLERNSLMKTVENADKEKKERIDMCYGRENMIGCRRD